MERSRAPKRLAIHQRVSGSFGDWVEGPTKRHRRQHLYGQVVQAEDAADQDEEEGLALEADDNEEAEDSDAVEQDQSQEAAPVGMPGQLPAGDNLPKDYASVMHGTAII